jgi:LacI family transcriptional regulator
MIGVVVSDIENPHFTQMVRVVENMAYQLGYRVLLCNTDEDDGKQQSYLEVLAAERVLGVILAASDPNGQEISDLLNLKIPIVAFDRPVRDPRADSVVIDNVQAGRVATRHIMAAGHSRIGLLSDPGVATVVKRLQGFEEEMRLADLQPRSVPGFSRIEGGAVATEQLLRTYGDITAIIAGNNLMAIGALRTIRAHALRIPDDIAFLTIDDPFWSDIVEPPLTALAQPVAQMATTLVELLMDRLETKREEPVHRVFEFEIHVRESCGTRQKGLG